MIPLIMIIYDKIIKLKLNLHCNESDINRIMNLMSVVPYKLDASQKPSVHLNILATIPWGIQWIFCPHGSLINNDVDRIHQKIKLDQRVKRGGNKLMQCCTYISLTFVLSGIPVTINAAHIAQAFRCTEQSKVKIMQ